MKPIIGITAECRQDPEDGNGQGFIRLNWNYTELIAEAGGLPLIIPPTADMNEVAKLIDGWLIPGGLDIDAERYGALNHPLNELQHPSRFEYESALYRAADSEMPILGICYGCQLINVLRGGDLIQHLPDVVGHERHSGGTLESYKIVPGSRLSGMVAQATVQGKSYHHQAIRRLGERMLAVATADDGTIEAIEYEGSRFLLGVQWHPERTPTDSPTKRLFETFVRSAAAFHASRSETRCAPITSA